MSTSKPVAEIAGAGLSGLAAAVALAQRGWDVRVHEKGRELREIGAGLYLWENALNALRELGVYDEIAASGVESRTPRRLADHNNHEIDLRRKADTVPQLIVILRTALHGILSERAISEGVEVITSSQALGTTSDGRLEFANGPGRKADLIIGADGVFSRVRDSLRLTKEIVELRDGCGRHLIPRRDGDGVNTSRVEVWNGGRRVGIAPASKDHHYIFLCCPENDIKGRMQQPFNLEAWVTSHPWYADYLERLPRHPEEYWRPFYNVRCTSWSSGHIAIIGDAAHGMAPNLGQGACVAIVNAVVLARVVTQAENIPHALQLWEQSERPYVDQTQLMSHLYGAVGTKWPRRLLALRSKLLPLIGKTRLVQKNLRCAVDHVPSI